MRPGWLPPLPRIRLSLLRLAEAGLDTLLPPRCLACLEPAWEGALLCRACAGRIPGSGPRCPRCARQVGTGSGAVGRRSGCPACVGPLAARDALARVDAEQPLGPVDHVVAGWGYVATPRDLVLALKFGGRLPAATLLGDTLADALLEANVPGDLFVPVPLSRRRLRQRGYNQAAILARVVARRLDLSVDGHALSRRRDTVQQTRLSLRGRLRGPRGAFVARRERVEGRLVLLVDDVLTSGATARACAIALRRARACRVVAAVACRAE